MIQMAHITSVMLKKMTVQAVLPRLLVFLGAASLLVYLELSRDGSRFTYSHGSYVALGITIGLDIAAVVSGLVIWLLKDKKQEPDN